MDEPPGPLSRQPPCPRCKCEHHWSPCECGCTVPDMFGLSNEYDD